jgi:hypothetical protein
MHLHHNRRHLCLERHLNHLLTVSEVNALNYRVHHLDMCIYILHFTKLNISITIHMPRIASTMKILFQICGLLKGHLLVSTASDAW